MCCGRLLCRSGWREDAYLLCGLAGQSSRRWREATDLEPAPPAVHGEAAKALRRRDDAPRRAAWDDREGPRPERVLRAVDGDRPRAGKDYERHVAPLVDVLRLSLSLTPDEERGVEVLAHGAPCGPAAVERREVDDLHAATVASGGLRTLSP